MIRDDVLAVGLIRDGAKTIATEIVRLDKVLKGVFSNISWLVVESDSVDSTIQELENLKTQVENFRYISCGVLRYQIPSRTERISLCRNRYLEELFTNRKYESVKYLIVLDLDGVNNLLTGGAIESCWLGSLDWDVCTANQSGNYYDIWALRHPFWSPNDYSLEIDFFLTQGVSYKKAMMQSLYSRMISLSKDSDWIAVDSAFGGFAIYKKNVLTDAEYIGKNAKGLEVCEHVYFHQLIRENNNARIFINPKLINTDFTPHSIHLKNPVRKALLNIRLLIAGLVRKL